jgi:GxxExxY protein
MKHEGITRNIIGAAMAVLNELKPGLDEKLYENAMVLELGARGHSTEQQREFPVQYRGHFIGKLVPDLIVDGKVIADPKVVSEFNDTHVAQDAWLSQHHWVGSGVAAEFQACQIDLETRSDRSRRRNLNCSRGPQQDHGLDVLRGFCLAFYPCHPCNPW